MLTSHGRCSGSPPPGTCRSAALDLGDPRGHTLGSFLQLSATLPTATQTPSSRPRVLNRRPPGRGPGAGLLGRGHPEGSCSGNSGPVAGAGRRLPRGGQRAEGTATAEPCPGMRKPAARPGAVFLRKLSTKTPPKVRAEDSGVQGQPTHTRPQRGGCSQTPAHGGFRLT